MAGLKAEHRVSLREAEALTRARVTLDAIYDTLMAVNLTVKPIIVAQLREVHATVWELEKKCHATFIIRALDAGRMKVDQLPDWFADYLPKSAPATAEQSEEKS